MVLMGPGNVTTRNFLYMSLTLIVNSLNLKKAREVERNALRG